MLVLLVLHAVLGTGAVAFGARLGRRALAVGVIGPVATLVWLVAQLGHVTDGGTVDEHVSWVPGLGIGLDLRLDGFAAAHGRCSSRASAWPSSPTRPATCPPTGSGLGRLIGLLTLFAGAMLGVVLGRQPAGAVRLLGAHLDHVVPADRQRPHQGPRPGPRRCRPCSSPAPGGLAMLAGFVLIGQAAGTYRLSALLADPPGGHGRRRWAWCWCCWARSPSRPSTRSTPGCPGPWWRRRRSAPTCTRPPW